MLPRSRYPRGIPSNGDGDERFFLWFAALLVVAVIWDNPVRGVLLVCALAMMAYGIYWIAWWANGRK